MALTLMVWYRMVGYGMVRDGIPLPGPIRGMHVCTTLAKSMESPTRANISANIQSISKKYEWFGKLLKSTFRCNVSQTSIFIQ